VLLRGADDFLLSQSPSAVDGAASASNANQHEPILPQANNRIATEEDGVGPTKTVCEQSNQTESISDARFDFLTRQIASLNEAFQQIRASIPTIANPVVVDQSVPQQTKQQCNLQFPQGSSVQSPEVVLPLKQNPNEVPFSLFKHDVNMPNNHIFSSKQNPVQAQNFPSRPILMQMHALMLVIQ